MTNEEAEAVIDRVYKRIQKQTGKSYFQWLPIPRFLSILKEVLTDEEKGINQRS